MAGAANLSSCQPISASFLFPGFISNSLKLLQPSLSIHLCRQLQHTPRDKSCPHSSCRIPTSRLQASHCGFSRVWLKQRNGMFMCVNVHMRTPRSTQVSPAGTPEPKGAFAFPAFRFPVCYSQHPLGLLCQFVCTASSSSTFLCWPVTGDGTLTALLGGRIHHSLVFLKPPFSDRPNGSFWEWLRTLHGTCLKTVSFAGWIQEMCLLPELGNLRWLWPQLCCPQRCHWYQGDSLFSA